MARRTFFSFHYANDVWRANIVRNSWVTQDRKAAGFIDAADFEEIKRGGDSAIKKWIREQLDGTSVTVVLIGSETSNRDYIKYELEKSWEKGNGILGIYVHNVKDSNGNTSKKGDNSFGPIFTNNKDDKKYFFERFKTYDWVDDNGYSNMGDWIEKAASDAGK
ncbi:TIR domain-containing protein [Winogradskyella immobilis]|uniref:TIR domain-containing protein n=1 Tax=Winogradskyella immobilis TaxID=2816852 RepID=A0ABS8EQR1_9FLAO|nr:TIR domain-containing protein [Winogradskyella immobilis]MCC1485574.1 TIR domain-containing protein [Winogradskyella immobilis]MCG0017666.1 TIR domain-containing protein [Winogradskyella immobilis]